MVIDKSTIPNRVPHLCEMITIHVDMLDKQLAGADNYLSDLAKCVSIGTPAGSISDYRLRRSITTLRMLANRLALVHAALVKETIKEAAE